METKRRVESQENKVEEVDRGNLERISSLQRLTCELLVKNQRLRMELMAERVETGSGRGSVVVLRVDERRVCTLTGLAINNQDALEFAVLREILPVIDKALPEKAPQANLKSPRGSDQRLR
jgi:hypothetical protein